MNRELYVCKTCGVGGYDENVISKGFCHKRNSGHRYGSTEVKTKKKEQKYRVKGMSKISVKKFNSYAKN